MMQAPYFQASIVIVFNEDMSKVFLKFVEQNASQLHYPPSANLRVGESPVQAAVRALKDDMQVVVRKDELLLFHFERMANGAELRYYTLSLKDDQETHALNNADRVVTLPVEQAIHTNKRFCYLLPMARFYIEHPKMRYLEG